MTIQSIEQTFTQNSTFFRASGAVLVDKLTDFAGDISFDKAFALVSGKPTLVSFNPNAKESDMDTMRYRGYAVRYAALSNGTVVRQLLTKSFGEPAWINLPVGASVKSIL
jgi:hypothetical protein